jgi:AcrR family transcriptional regulator
MKRAQSDEQKESRRKEILKAAKQALGRQDYREIRLKDLADGVGLVKGTFYRYFPTKQDLFMALYLEELDEWLAAWSDAFQGGKPEPDRLEGILVDSLEARPLLVRLIGSFPGDLEPELSDEGLKDYKRFMKRYLSRAQAALGGLSPRLGAKAPMFLISIFVLIQGSAPLAFPVSRVDRLLRGSREFAVFRLGFRGLFAPLLRAVFGAYLGEGS